MKKKRYERTEAKKGFTLIELMIALSIIAILAALSIPKYMNYQCKSKQIEARQQLGSLAKFEETYYSVYDTFTTDKDAIGFSVKGGSYYDYDISDATAATYKATAVSVDPGVGYKGKADDMWTINQSLHLVNRKNACQN